jgi:hypothetical protein
MLYVILASNLIFNLKNYVKMHDKSIENCYVENAILGKDFNPSMICFFFMFSPKCDRANNVMPICMASYMTAGYGHANHAFRVNVRS